MVVDGSASVGGMITSTLLAIFFVPLFYVVMQHISEWRKPIETKPHEPAASEACVRLFGLAAQIVALK